MSEVPTSETPSNVLKRKNEELEVNENEVNDNQSTSSNQNKRVALDSEQLDLHDKDEEKVHTAPSIGTLAELEEPKQEEPPLEEKEEEDSRQEGSEEVDVTTAPSAKHDSSSENASSNASSNDEKTEVEPPQPVSSKPELTGAQTVQQILEQAALLSDLAPPPPSSSAAAAPPPSAAASASASAPATTATTTTTTTTNAAAIGAPVEPNAPVAAAATTEYESPPSSSKPVSNHREKESDPTFVSLRMYVPVKEASTIVGKQGAKINHLREKANVRIQISDNIRGVPERIVSVKGPAENVAKAFNLITRTILNEPEDEPANMNSQQYNLKLLIPHPLVGFIIGKQGLKFREIEENSAAKLKAAEQPLPYSTDRVLSVMGVADAIHIAIYFISLVIIEHQDTLKKNKVVLYNPANYQPENSPFEQQSQYSNMQQQQQPPSQQQQHQQQPLGQLGQQYGANPMFQNKMTSPFQRSSQQQQQQQQQQPQQPQQQPPSQYDFSMMFQPSVQPQNSYGALPPQQAPGISAGVPHQDQYTDEYNNTIIGEVIINPPVRSGDKYNQDIYVANSSIGSVIGRGGNNIKHIRENSGCSYVKIEPDRGQSIMLGGRGLTNIRKLTLTGGIDSFQKAIYLINQRINADRERNAR
ncbi:PBP2 [Candida oxycetoniae]|uniref:PBP2 n=1 Tax=Candida oxycetoniae TaxID=497107 RepID=A0AAI9WYB6_9ASCO|nr:PBP2 [Candida oxycetoniae]KAI3404968.2 PBP2 [Candida oxycetoniae]